jgi:hypothetical protein
MQLPVHLRLGWLTDGQLKDLHPGMAPGARTEALGESEVKGRALLVVFFRLHISNVFR